MRVRIDNREYDVSEGATISDALREAAFEDAHRILAASVNGELRRLSERLNENDSVFTIRSCTEDGYRIYRQSLMFVLISAVNRVFPGRKLYIRQSVNRSTYCELSGETVDETDIRALRDEMLKMVEECFPINVIKVKKSEAISMIRKAGETERAESLEFIPNDEFSLYISDGRYYSVYGVTVPHAGYLREFDVMNFEAGFLLRYPHPDMGGVMPPFHASKKIIETINEYSEWNEVIGVSDVIGLNRIIASGKIKDCINISEIMHEKKIFQIAEEIKNDILNKKVVLISGPSSSGKTTFANRLMLHLRVNGIRPVIISLDDYFWGKEKEPILDETGQKNYEDLEAIDYKLFSHHLSELIRGEEVVIPRFNFTTGDREREGRRLRLDTSSVVIVEGIHALNEKLTYGVPSRFKYKIYCSALTVMSFDKYNPISPTDTRLLRRIIRDFNFRNSSAAETLDMWNSVQKGEIKNIFPFEEAADVIFNSALAYEFAVYKNLAEPLLREALAECENNPRVQRLLELLSYFMPMDDKYIPPTSILREFIGKSSIKY